MDNNLIEIDNIALLRNEKSILENISFHIKKSKALNLYGLNGSGKTSLLKIIVGMTEPTSGFIKNVSGDEDLFKKTIYIGHKYGTKGNLTVEENLFSGDSCTVSNFGFTNRIIHVSRDTVLAPVCWELCDDCNSGPTSYTVTFKLDMTGYVGPPFSIPEVNGTFNNWCGSCWAMEDLDGDNIW